MIRIHHLFLIFMLLTTGNAFGQQVGTPHQWSTGMLNLSYTSHNYLTLSGNAIFSGGNGPKSLGTNFQYQYLHEIEGNDYFSAWSYGGEYAWFTSTSSSVYPGSGAVSGPSIDMTMQITFAQMRLYFTPALDELFIPYIGVGWGYIQGQFDIDDGVDQSKSNFSGPITYQVFGAKVELEAEYGFLFEFRTTRANQMKVYYDHFNVAGGAPFTADYSGAMVNLTGYYLF